MSVSIRFLTLLILLFLGQLSYGQEKSYQYQLDGSYPATLPGLSSPQTVRFSIIWNEKNQLVDGLYSDNFFTAKSRVTGTVGSQGRVFKVQLPRIIQNVSNLSLTSNANFVMIFMKDPTAMTIDQANIQAAIITREDYIREIESACDVGFGVLSGYCGIYHGKLNKLSDTNNICNLPDYGFRLELSADATTNLYFYYSDTTIGIPSHNLGPFPSAPMTTAVNLIQQHCGVLVGTNFPASGCHSLSLIGAFGESGFDKTFRGRYTIKSDRSSSLCIYELIMEREKRY